jgi:hypothetical protein
MKPGGKRGDNQRGKKGGGGGRRKRPGASDEEKRTAAKTTTEGKGQELVGTVPNLPGGPEKPVDEGKGQGVVVGQGVGRLRGLGGAP